jgi:hypothetical protein
LTGKPHLVFYTFELEVAVAGILGAEHIVLRFWLLMHQDASLTLKGLCMQRSMGDMLGTLGSWHTFFI